MEIHLSVKRLNRILRCFLRLERPSDEGTDFPIRWNIITLFDFAAGQAAGHPRGLDPELAGIAAALHDIAVVATRDTKGMRRRPKDISMISSGAYNAKAGTKLASITKQERDQIVRASPNTAIKRPTPETLC